MYIFVLHCLHQNKRNDNTESWGKIKTLDKLTQFLLHVLLWHVLIHDIVCKMNDQELRS